MSEEEFTTLRRVCVATGARSLSDLAREAMRGLLSGANQENPANHRELNTPLRCGIWNRRSKSSAQKLRWSRQIVICKWPSREEGRMNEKSDWGNQTRIENTIAMRNRILLLLLLPGALCGGQTTPTAPGADTTVCPTGPGPVPEGLEAVCPPATSVVPNPGTTGVPSRDQSASGYASIRSQFRSRSRAQRSHSIQSGRPDYYADRVPDLRGG